MTTAIIGVGNIGSALAANLVRGGEDVVLASHDLKHAQAVADNLGYRTPLEVEMEHQESLQAA